DGERAAGGAFSLVEDEPVPEALAPTLTYSVLERAAIEEIRKMGGPAGDVLVTRVVGQYLGTAPRLAATIRESIEGGNTDAAWRAAHTLKSSSGTLGARKLAACCLEIEQTARAGNSDAVKAMLAPLDRALAEVIAELKPLGPPEVGS